MKQVTQLSWWYWMLTCVLLAAAVWGWSPGFPAVIGFTLVHSVHYLVRAGAVAAFAVQVRLGYLALLVTGLWPPLAFVHWIQLAGTLAVVTVDYCPLARIFSLLPWNRRSPLTWRLVLRTFVQPPRQFTVPEVP